MAGRYVVSGIDGLVELSHDFRDRHFEEVLTPMEARDLAARLTASAAKAEGNPLLDILEKANKATMEAAAKAYP